MAMTCILNRGSHQRRIVRPIRILTRGEEPLITQQSTDRDYRITLKNHRTVAGAGKDAEGGGGGGEEGEGEIMGIETIQDDLAVFLQQEDANMEINVTFLMKTSSPKGITVEALTLTLALMGSGWWRSLVRWRWGSSTHFIQHLFSQ